MKNIVLIDFKSKKDWHFTNVLETITERPWMVLECPTNQYHGGVIASLKRLYWYFMFPLQIALKRNRFDKIIAWQQFYGLNFAFWSRLFHLKKTNDMTVMTFIYKKKKGLMGLLYHKYMSYIVKSKYIDRFICFSEQECTYYPTLFKVDSNRFIYIPVGIEPINGFDTKDMGYIFATGRSNRDYKFLADTLYGTDYSCVIACDTTTLQGGQISVLNDCYGDKMLDLMAHSHCVVIPLKELNVSSGQLVILQAMALGKPVICTDADGIRNYTSKDTAIMIPNEKKEWRKALALIYTDTNKYNSMCKAAYERFKNEYTHYVMFKNIANIIR